MHFYLKIRLKIEIYLIERLPDAEPCICSGVLRESLCTVSFRGAAILQGNRKRGSPYCGCADVAGQLRFMDLATDCYP